MTRVSSDRPRLLCVDDEPHILAALSDTLRWRFTVVTATRPREALAILAERGPFEVVISDFRMPGMNGAELLRQARVIAPDTIRILLTGQASIENAMAAVNDGNIFRLLLKPYPPADLIRATEEALAMREALVGEREGLRQQVATLSAHLRRADRLATLGTMAGAVGHEINNLLMGVAGARSLIELDQQAGRPPRAAAMKLIADAQSQLTVHARNLLQLGRPPHAETKQADLRATAADIGDALRTAGIVRGSILETHLPAAAVPVRATRTELQQVLVNLIKNAVEAFDVPAPASARIEVALTSDTRTRTATMTVADNATGIPADKLPLVFEPYYTSKSADSGTGLGLFVVRQIVRDAGGDIAVDSREGYGTTFTVVLPLAPAA